MKGFNLVVLMGNMARDPEIRYTTNKTAVAKFAIGVNRAVKQADGSYQDEVIFPTIIAWGTLATFAEKWLKKGSGVLIEGRLNIRSYDDKDGIKRTVTEVIANQIQFAGSKSNVDSDAPAPPQKEYAPLPKSQRQYSSARAAARNKVPSAPGFEVGAPAQPTPAADPQYAYHEDPASDIPF